MRTIDERRRPLALARAATWIELVAGGAAVGLAIFVWTAAPSYGGGMTGSPPRIEVIGIVGIVVGFAWMLRIRLADPESGAPSWRYRSDS